MSVYLYAVAMDLPSLDDLTGTCGEPLVVLRAGEMAIVAGSLAQKPSITPAMLATQDAVVRQLHARATALLPMRFGTAFASEDDAIRAVASQSARLDAQLRLVTGREQMTWRVLMDAAGAPGRQGAADPPASSNAEEGPGAAYLRARAAAAGPRVITPLMDAVKTHVHATRVEPGRAAGVVATVYHLIERGDDAAYREAVCGVAGQVPQVSVRITGPAPCYAFT